MQAFLDKVDWGSVPPPAGWSAPAEGNFEDAEEPAPTDNSK